MLFVLNVGLCHRRVGVSQIGWCFGRGTGGYAASLVIKGHVGLFCMSQTYLSVNI